MTKSSLTQAKLIEIVDAPIARMAELVATVLPSLNYRIKMVNEKLQKATAFENTIERRDAGKLAFRLEYDVLLNWRQIAKGVELSVQVTEKVNNWTGDECQSRCEEILDAIHSDAGTLKQVDSQALTRYGSARWADDEDFKKADYFSETPSSQRLILGPLDEENRHEYYSLDPSDTAKHAIVCGPTGSGKTTAIFIPNLVERLCSSAIVTEATAGSEAPDLFFKTSGFRAAEGNQHIYYFNPDDMRSHRVNPLDAVDSYAKAQQLSYLIIENTTSKNNYGDDVWPKSEANLLTILIAHAAAEKKHLGYVRALLREGPDGLMPTLRTSKVPEVVHEFKGFCNNAKEGFKYGVFAGLMQRLGLWVNPRIVALTEKTDFDLETLQRQLFTFYLATPAQKTHLKPVAALIFNFILDQALERKFDYPLFLSLDEFTNFGMIPGIAEKLSIIRHREIGVVLGFQDFSQILKVYGKDDAQQLFSQPGTKFFFRPRTLETAEKISKMAGTETIEERKVSTSGHVNVRESSKPLISPGEVLALDDNKMIVFTPKCPPRKMDRFSWQDFKSSVMPPVSRPEIKLDERLVRECELLAAKEKKPSKSQEEKVTEPTHSSAKKKIEPEPEIDMDEKDDPPIDFKAAPF